ncbi:hypothetical protein KKB55_02610 [Myxococcota bacterium]|nr:hypothetical protein [Myxococcota bacterium]MBU1896642.1 hypothetical protein [Myxococcota bacterium]
MIPATTRALLPLLSLLPSLWAGVIHAQGVAKPTPKQDELMLAGRRAYQAKDYALAAALYAEANAIGPINIALLNEGRARQRLNDCTGAVAAYERVARAPTIDEVTPDTVRGAMERYLDELRSTCPGNLYIHCDPSDMTLSLADAEAGLLDEKSAGSLPPLTCGRAVALPPGIYRVTGAAYDRTRPATARITGTQTTLIELFIDPNPAPEVIVKGGDINYKRLGGWSAVSLGVVGLIGGVFFSALVDQSNEDARELDLRDQITRDEIKEIQRQGDLYEVMQFLSYGAALTGLTSGAILLYLDAQAGPASPSADARLAVTPWMSPSVQGAALTWGF